MTELDHLSYSSISTFLACPESWRRKYIAKEPTVSSPALIFGSAIHNTVEQYVQVGGDLLSIWGEKWGAQLEKDGASVLWGMETPDESYNKGVKVLSDKDIAVALKEIKPRQVERKVELRVPGVEIPIIGYIDIITEDGVVCDLKTSAKSWTSARAKDELQPIFYLMSLNQAGEKVNWKFRHYVLTTLKSPRLDVFDTERSPAEAFFLINIIQQVWLAIQSEIFIPNPGSWKCSPSYCDFFASCRGKYM